MPENMVLYPRADRRTNCNNRCNRCRYAAIVFNMLIKSPTARRGAFPMPAVVCPALIRNGARSASSGGTGAKNRGFDPRYYTPLRCRVTAARVRAFSMPEYKHTSTAGKPRTRALAGLYYDKWAYYARRTAHRCPYNRHFFPFCRFCNFSFTFVDLFAKSDFCKISCKKALNSRDSRDSRATFLAKNQAHDSREPDSRDSRYISLHQRRNATQARIIISSSIP